MSSISCLVAPTVSPRKSPAATRSMIVISPAIAVRVPGRMSPSPRNVEPAVAGVATDIRTSSSASSPRAAAASRRRRARS